MALRRTDRHVDKGVSLARGPALIIGSILLAAGLVAMLSNGDTPSGGFPDGTVSGDTLLGFETNGWSAFFTAAGGGLLLFGAAQHLLAKTMSLLVGLALGACSVIALVDGDDVLGLAAANGPTKLGWGIASALLLINALLPRKGGGVREKPVRDEDRGVATPSRRHREREGDGVVDRREAAAPGVDRDRDGVADRQERDPAVVGRDGVADRDEVVDRDAARRGLDGTARPGDAAGSTASTRVHDRP